MASAREGAGATFALLATLESVAVPSSAHFPAGLVSAAGVCLAALAAAGSSGRDQSGSEESAGQREGTPAGFCLFLVQTSTQHSPGVCRSIIFHLFDPFVIFRPPLAPPEKLGSQDLRVGMNPPRAAAVQTLLHTSPQRGICILVSWQYGCYEIHLSGDLAACRRRSRSATKPQTSFLFCPKNRLEQRGNITHRSRPGRWIRLP